MKKIFAVFASVMLVGLMACNTNYSTTKSGLKYKIFSGKASGAENKGTQLSIGDITKFSFKITIPEQKDTPLRTVYEKMPAYIKVDTGMQALAQAPFLEVFPKLKIGDSLIVLLSTDSILNKNPMGGTPPFIKKGQHIKFTISILNAFKTDSLARADGEKEQVKEDAREKTKFNDAQLNLDKYITSNNIKATKTPDGVYVVIDNPGDTSAKIDSDLEVAIHYSVSVVGNNKPFESNFDSSAKSYHKDTLRFVVGQHRTIPGMDEGIKYFSKGATGKIYVPAKLAYGPQEGPDFSAYSNLVFNVEVLDVKKPAAAAIPSMNPQGKMTPEQQKQMMEQIKKQMQAKQGAAPTAH